MTIYTDGSFIKKTYPTLCGYSAVLIKGKDKNGYLLDILYGASNDPICVASWNAGGEILAAINGITLAIDRGETDITIYHDHLGVGCWADGQWKTNLELTRSYAELIKNWRKDGITIKFKHVRGHSNDLLNNVADNFAKKGIYEYTDNENFYLLKDITIISF